jgi:hemerythrin-like domain-containing protein|tara:strand:- start:24 stop:341 length:318 start_codon:yes stop_codon:yes gene_type:complete
VRLTIKHDPEACVETIQDKMSTDHDRCDRLFAEAEAVVTEDGWEQGAVRFVAFSEAVQRHFAMEEEVLFPRLEAVTGISTGGPTEIMRSEHAQMRNLLSNTYEAP